MSQEKQNLIPAHVAAFGSIGAVFFGVALGMAFSSSSYVGVERSALKADQLRSDELSWRTVPDDILVHIRSPEKVKAECGPDIYACTAGGGRPCEMWIPSGQEILFYPRAARARWADPFNDRMLAHEFLHCYFPNWHAAAVRSERNP